IPAPTITLSADPLQIVQGGSSTLAWSTVNADAVSIDQGIGNVQTAGSRVIFPDSDTTYAITATGPGGISTRSVTVTVVSPISIQVISPVDGESINRPDVMVHGTFSNTTLGETGITVNGKVAETWNGHFVVNHVPLQEGSNAITVTATDQNGYVQTASVSVPAAIPEHHIEISSNIESGSSPLELTLHINGTFSINDSTMSHNGPGSVELIETEPDEYHVSLIDEGITYFTAEVVHETVTYKDTMAVVVVDIAEIDALLQQKWVDMKTQLSERNVEGAIQYFDDSKKSLYDELFSVLIDGLPQIANDMQNISIISVTDKIAKYRIRRIETHGAVSYPITYYIYFINNENGIWKIHRF
ncbi:MAG: hypothetical protein HGJ94_13855, partial [Desulfosarcina sp.]|nr:hypothetical protein [Desulfosarcina sp.]